MKSIPLTKGYVTWVDDDVYEWASQLMWHVGVHGDRFYAKHNVYICGKRQRGFIMLHRLIMGVWDSKVYVDHINGNTSLNLRENLRVCNHKNNSRNQRGTIGASSAYKGVCWHSRDKVWQSRIKVDYKYKHLGYFTSELDAAHAYDTAALKYFGQFARLNFPQKDRV
jgi:hypothetical protein